MEFVVKIIFIQIATIDLLPDDKWFGWPRSSRSLIRVAGVGFDMINKGRTMVQVSHILASRSVEGRRHTV